LCYLLGIHGWFCACHFWIASHKSQNHTKRKPNREINASVNRERSRKEREKKERRRRSPTYREIDAGVNKDRSRKEREKKEKIRRRRRRRRRRRSGLDVIDIKIKMKKEINKKYWKNNRHISKFSKLAMVFLKINISGKV
jgi:hypothetical protein